MYIFPVFFCGHLFVMIRVTYICVNLIVILMFIVYCNNTVVLHSPIDRLLLVCSYHRFNRNWTCGQLSYCAIK
jgi:hypothetical protein